MKFKKAAALIVTALFLLSGCTSDSNNENAAFTISDQAKTSLYQLIESTLNSFYWRYDSDSIIFDSGSVPTDSTAIEASLESGYDISSKQGQECTIATADLLYFNRETAGTVYFYFDNNKLIGLYYVPTELSSPCSMYVRNPYLISSAFNVVESGTEYSYSKKYASKFENNGVFDSITIDNNTYTVFDDGTKLTINLSDSLSSFNTYKIIDYTSDKLIPMSAVFINDSSQLAVLYGTETYSDGSSVPTVVSKEIRIFDKDFNLTDSIIEADDCYSVGYANGCLLVSRNEAIDFYTLDGTAASPKQISFYIGKNITGMEISDIDNDGEQEYIFTDSLDLYIYRKTLSVFKCIWSTHMSIDSYEKYITAADINNDGVEEIYVYDSTGTTSKYIIRKNGLSTNNDAIEYGQRWYISDFNSDGKYDILVVGDTDSNMQELRITN